MVALLCALAVRVNYRQPRSSGRRGASQREGILAAFTIVTVVSVFFVLAAMRGSDLAWAAKRGDFLRQADSLLLITAQPVCLTSPGLGEASSGPYMYLGSANGDLVLWELGPARPGDQRAAEGRLVRLPDSGTHIVQMDIDLMTHEAREQAAKDCAAYRRSQGLADKVTPSPTP